MSSAETAPELSVVIPAFNEAQSITLLLVKLEEVLRSQVSSFEVLVIDDGSSDHTFEEVLRLTQNHSWLRGIRLSRNFGKEGALLAGLIEAKGRAVLTMDADMQHPPDVLPRMIKAWREGAKIVHATKSDRSVDNSVYSLFAYTVTGLLSKAAGIPLQSASDFKLLDRIAVDVITHDITERERFFRGLASWIGYTQVSIPFKVAASVRQERRWTIWALGRLALTALTSFTGAPLQIITVLGFITLGLAVVIGGDALLSWQRHEAVSGYTTVISTLLILGSFIMISLGILGFYVDKIYKEIKRRPPYLVEARTEQRTAVSRELDT